MKVSSGEQSVRYLTGFLLALGLTLLAFLAVYAKIGVSTIPVAFALERLPGINRLLTESPRWVWLSGILVLACLQLGVHLRFFLHLDFGPRDGPAVQALLFTVMIVIIAVCGTLWILNDLNRRMTPDRPPALENR